MADDSASKAATVNDALLRFFEAYHDASWFQSVGVGGDKIFVYAKTDPSGLPNKYLGYELEVVVVGEIHPATR